MRQVLDLHQDRASRLPVGALEFHPADIRPGVGDRRGDVRVETPPVVPLEREPHEKPLARRALPVDLEPALGLMCEEQQVGTVRPVNAHAASTRDVSRDRIARHGLAALRVADHEPVHALNLHALRAADAIDEALHERRLRSLSFRRIREEMPDREADAHVALPDGRVQLGLVAQREGGRGGVEALVVGPAQATPLELPVEDILAELHRRGLLLVSQPLPDLVARPACTHV